NGCRQEFQRDAHEQRQCVTAFRMPKLGEQHWSECEGELIDCNDEANNTREMLLWEFLLNNKAWQRRRIPNTSPEQHTAEVKQLRCRARRKDGDPECLPSKIDTGHNPPVKFVNDKSGGDASDYGSERRQTDSPTSGYGSDARR